MKRASTQSRKTRNNSLFETLEGRQLMSVSPLVINGTSGNDVITVNYGLPPVVVQSQATTTTTAARATAVTRSVVYRPPTIFNRLTYTVNDAATTTTLQTGQTVVVNGLDGNDIITVTGTVNTQLNGGNGNDVIIGGAGNDIIHGNAGDDIEYGGAGNDVIYSDAGNDNEYGQAGDDRMYGGSGVDYLYGNDGNDTLVTIGGSHIDREFGGAGNNSFWLDKESTECVVDATAFEAAHNVHRVGAYDALHVNGVNYGAPARGIGVGNLPDPYSGSATKNFASTPLFSNTPIADDVNQGAVGDCYFLATLSAVAKNDANAIRQSVVDLGDGTYAVDFKKNGADHFIRVDADLPVYSSGGLEFAHFGSKPAALWVPIMEKAFAFFRTGAGTYSSTANGFPSESFNALGISNSSYMPHHEGFLDLQSESAQDFGNHMASLLAGGNAVVLCTPSDSAYLVGSHCYMVDHVNSTNGVVTSITLRNPWGTDGRGGDGVNDGYVTLTDLDVLKSVDLATYARA